MFRLKELRKTKGLTQSELAERLETTQATISDWEVSKAEPSIEWLIKIATFFNVSIDFLVGKQNENSCDNVLKQVAKLKTDRLFVDAKIKKLTQTLEDNVNLYERAEHQEARAKMAETLENFLYQKELLSEQIYEITKKFF